MNAGIRQYVQSALGRDDAKTVSVVSPRRDLLDSLKSAVKEEKRFQIVTIQGNLSQVQSQFGTGGAPQVLVADLRDDIEASISSIETLRKSGFNGAIILISDTLDEVGVAWACFGPMWPTGSRLMPRAARSSRPASAR